MNSTPSLDDNLPSRQASVLKRLGDIRGMKQRILEMLNALKKDKTDEEVDKTALAKLLEAYDQFKQQEDEYVNVLQQILMIRTTAADDVAAEMTRTPVISDATHTTDSSQDDQGEIEDTEERANIDADVAALAACVEKAAIASHMHDQLLNSLQLKRNKKAVMNEIHAEQRDAQLAKAQHALRQAELTRQRLLAEQNAIETRRAELEQLRAQARTRGIAQGAAQPRIETDAGHEEAAQSANKKSKKKSATAADAAIDSAIAEKLAAIKARKERIREITERLGQSEQINMDDTYRAAQEQLRRLTAMRERLENLQQLEVASSPGDALTDGCAADTSPEANAVADAVGGVALQCERLTDGMEQALAEQNEHIAQLMHAVTQANHEEHDGIEKATDNGVNAKEATVDVEGDESRNRSAIEAISQWLNDRDGTANIDGDLVDQLGRIVVAQLGEQKQEMINKTDKILQGHLGSTVGESRDQIVKEITDVLRGAGQGGPSETVV